MSLKREQKDCLKKYASEMQAAILNKVRYGDDVGATAAFHRLQGVRKAAFLVDDLEVAGFIGRILKELETLDCRHGLRE